MTASSRDRRCCIPSSPSSAGGAPEAPNPLAPACCRCLAAAAACLLCLAVACSTVVAVAVSAAAAAGLEPLLLLMLLLLLLLQLLSLRTSVSISWGVCPTRCMSFRAHCTSSSITAPWCTGRGWRYMSGRCCSSAILPVHAAYCMSIRPEQASRQHACRRGQAASAQQAELTSGRHQGDQELHDMPVPPAAWIMAQFSFSRPTALRCAFPGRHCDGCMCWRAVQAAQGQCRRVGAAPPDQRLALWVREEHLGALPSAKFFLCGRRGRAGASGGDGCRCARREAGGGAAAARPTRCAPCCRLQRLPSNSLTVLGCPGAASCCWPRLWRWTSDRRSSPSLIVCLQRTRSAAVTTDTAQRLFGCPLETLVCCVLCAAVSCWT